MIELGIGDAALSCHEVGPQHLARRIRLAASYRSDRNMELSGFQGFVEAIFGRSLLICQFLFYIYIYMGVSKNRGTPKMDGENNGKPY